MGLARSHSALLFLLKIISNEVRYEVEMLKVLV
jgi:hypothetical protein